MIASVVTVAELKEAFRAMKPDADKLPVVGNGARCLGIRAEGDIIVNNEGLAVPGGGGMSVATESYWYLPAHRRPKSLGNGSSGPIADCVYRVALPLDPELNLTVREDLPEEHHAVVEPSSPTTRGEYEAALTATRAEWKPVWP
jgi:hypothetical protein